MKRLACLGLAALAWLPISVVPACSDSEGGASGTPAETPEELARLMASAVDELRARPEIASPRVAIQHLLVAVKGGGVPGAEKSPAEAALLAAELFARARRGEDFDTLVKNYTDDPSPGVLVMELGEGATPPAYSRSELAVPGLGDVAWRLAVGEVGVAPFDGGSEGREPRSPLGYHLIKRVE